LILPATINVLPARTHRIKKISPLVSQTTLISKSYIETFEKWLRGVSKIFSAKRTTSGKYLIRRLRIIFQR
jgi:hypothetical protein